MAGRNYYTPPSFVCVDSASRNVIEGVAFKATLSSGSITDVDIISSAKGLASVQHELFTVNNTNGINIKSLTATAEGLVTATLYYQYLDSQLPHHHLLLVMKFLLKELQKLVEKDLTLKIMDTNSLR